VFSDSYRIKEIPGNMHKTDFDASLYRQQNKQKKVVNLFMENISNEFNNKRKRRKAK
jgi:hypothetical protein